MKIDDRKGVQGPMVDGLGTVGGGSPQPAPDPPEGDQVSVSSVARDLSRLRGELGDVRAEVDSVRQDKVAGLRAVMAKGQYSADVKAVARKVLRAHLEQAVA
jgi:flagellar biosynthesis anti-sigma factor FlgM